MATRKKKPEIIFISEAAPEPEAAVESESGLGLEQMKNLSELVKRADVVCQGAANLQAELESCRIQACDEEKRVVYRCDGTGKPVSIYLAPNALRECSATDLSARILSAMAAGALFQRQQIQQKLEALSETPENAVLLYEGQEKFNQQMYEKMLEAFERLSQLAQVRGATAMEVAD